MFWEKQAQKRYLRTANKWKIVNHILQNYSKIHIIRNQFAGICWKTGKEKYEEIIYKFNEDKAVSIF